MTRDEAITKLAIKMTRDEAITKLAIASMEGRLVILAGAGFSKALTKGKMPSWPDLLNRVGEELKVQKNLSTYTKIPGKNDVQDIKLDYVDNLVGYSLPQIASKMVSDVKTTQSIAREDAVRIVKNEVCKVISNEKIDEEIKTNFSDLFKELKISAFITTNYDLFIEECLGWSSYSVIPPKLPYTKRNFTPVIHIHGCIHEPEGTIITNEDYVRFLQNQDAYLTRLSFLLEESVVLMVGYGLSDINVQSAIVPNQHREKNDNLFFLERESIPIHDPITKGTFDEWIIQSEEIISFLNEIKKKSNEVEEKYQSITSEIIQYLKDNLRISDSPAYLTDNQIEDFVNIVEKSRDFLSSMEVLNFISSVLGFAQNRTAINNNWTAYENCLKLLFHLFKIIDIDSIQPMFFRVLAEHLGRVAQYVGYEDKAVVGLSVSATKFWHEEARNINLKWIERLTNYAEHNSFYRLKHLLKNLPSVTDQTPQ